MSFMQRYTKLGRNLERRPKWLTDDKVQDAGIHWMRGAQHWAMR